MLKIQKRCENQNNLREALRCESCNFLQKLKKDAFLYVYKKLDLKETSSLAVLDMDTIIKDYILKIFEKEDVDKVFKCFSFKNSNLIIDDYYLQENLTLQVLLNLNYSLDMCKKYLQFIHVFKKDQFNKYVLSIAKKNLNTNNKGK